MKETAERGEHPRTERDKEEEEEGKEKGEDRASEGEGSMAEWDRRREEGEEGVDITLRE